MTLTEFANTAPGRGNFELYLSGGNNVVAMTVSIFNCSNINYSYPLQLVQIITIGGVNIEIDTRESKGTYYYFTTTPTEIDPNDPAFNDGSCDLLTFTPNIDPIPFTYNIYNALIGNSEAIRTSSFVYDVDKKTDQIIPANIDAILNDFATPAMFQDSNYTDSGLINARYNGTKTTVADFGTSPAFSGLTVEASVYAVSTANSFICSQSLSDRDIEEVVIGYDASATATYTGTDADLEEVKIEYVPLAKFYYTSGQIDPGDTELTFNTYVDVYPDDIIRIKSGTPEEVVKVVSVTTKTSSSTIITVIRGYKSNIDPNNNATTFVNNTFLQISKLTGTQLFKPEGNRLYRLFNKKVWIKDSSKVFYIDEGGRALFNLVVCSI